jgi:hypothetical protein
MLVEVLESNAHCKKKNAKETIRSYLPYPGTTSLRLWSSRDREGSKYWKQFYMWKKSLKIFFSITIVRARVVQIYMKAF